MTDVCTHLDTIRVASLPESVPEDWCWCYEDEIAFRVDLAGAGK
jgi:hypothetical protein